MAINKQHIFEQGIYFVTFTNYQWLHLFHITQSYDLVYKWFDALKRNGHQVMGYVIMPNHLHMLMGYKTAKASVNTTVGNGKRFMAYDIVERLKESHNTHLLNILEKGVTKSDRSKGAVHEVFEPSFDVKLCRTFKFVQQKLNYIHVNPVSKKWMLANSPIDYIHSSARFYETGSHSTYEVSHVNDWIFEHWE